MQRLKRITTYRGHAQFLAELEQYGIGTIPRQPEISSPYAYSPTHTVHVWHHSRVFLVGTAHKQYDVFEVPPGVTVTPFDSELSD